MYLQAMVVYIDIADEGGLMSRYCWVYAERDVRDC